MAPNRSQVSRYPVKLDGDATANVPDSNSQTFSSQGSRLPVEDEEGAARIPMRKISSYVTMAHPHKASDGDVELYWENSPAIPSNEEDYWVDKRCRNEGGGFNNLDVRRDLFWEWPSDTELQDKHAPILATILQDEVARRQVSVSKIEKNLLTRKLTTQKEEGQEQEQKQQPSYDDYWQWDSLSVPSPRHHGHRVVDADSYWEWKSPSAEEEKLQVIERILKAEAHRQMFLVERIEERLIKASSSNDNEESYQLKTRSNAGTLKMEESEEYWSTPTGEGDSSYWEFPSNQHKVMLTSCDAASYWDF